MMLQKIINRLERLHPKKIDLSLERTFNLLKKLGNPQDKIKNVIILLHGYGGDGADISSIAYTWRRFIDNTIFLCPNGHQVCKLNPNGFQLFDLSNPVPMHQYLFVVWVCLKGG